MKAASSPRSQHEHAVRLGLGTAEILRLAERATEQPHVSADGGEQGGNEAELKADDGIGRIAGSDQQNAVFDAVRQLVVDRAVERLPAAFDGDHPVEHVAQQAQLHGHGADQEMPRRSDTRDQHRRADQRDDDADDRHAVGADAARQRRSRRHRCPGRAS